MQKIAQHTGNSFLNYPKTKHFNIQEIIVRVVSSGKWRLSWDRFETKKKFKIQGFLNSNFLNFCPRFKSAPVSPISHYSRTTGNEIIPIMRLYAINSTG